MLTLDQVYHAAYVLKDVIRETELISAPQVNPESEIYLKTEIYKFWGHLKQGVRTIKFRSCPTKKRHKEL